MDKPDFRERLQGPPILFDGGMGTELYQRGIYVNRCFDELNATQPELVKTVHIDYLRAGAEVIETNTYGANRFKLAGFGLKDRVSELNRLGVENARAAIKQSGRQAFIAGSIGPLGKRLAPLGTLSLEEAREAFAEQAQGLLEGGVDLIVIETMTVAVELIQAVAAVRSLSNLPLITQFTLNDWNETAYGSTLPLFAARLQGLDIDALGINCSLGPSKLLEAAKALLEYTDKPLSIQPNAGELEWVAGRLISKATPEYFAEYARRLAQAGVKIVGGCCGSTPAHIRAMDAALRAMYPDPTVVSVAPPRKVVKTAEHPTRSDFIKPYRAMSPLAEAFDDERFVFCVEITSPRSPSIESVLAKVQVLKDNGVRVVNIPDGPRASARLSAMTLAQAIQRATGLDTITHYTCRDRNILGIQSDLFGAELLGTKNILCITGDPPKLGDYPMATAVFDVDSIGLLHIADNLNHGLDLAGNPIPQSTALLLGCGANPGAVDLELEIERLRRKLDNGACYILTQPVFDEALFFEFLDRVDIPEVPVLAGILPLASYRNAEFYHNEVPGMQVPQWIRERLKTVEDREEAARVGVELAAEILGRVAPRAAGAYLMPPFGRMDLALEVIRRFKGSEYGSTLKW